MAEPAGIRAVIFDMDGVLTDSEPLINAAAIAMFQELGLPVQPADFLPFVGTGENRYLGGVAEKYGFPLDLPAAKRRTYEIYLGLVPGRLEAFPGAAALVRACRAAGLKVAVASSADRIKIEANLRKIDLPLETWDAVVTGEDVEKKKPAPDIFLMAAEKLGLTPTACTVVEDAVNGVEAARAAGMRCVAVAQSFPRERLQSADLVRGTIAEVTVGDLTGALAPPPLGGGPPPLETGVPPGLAGAAPAQPWGFWTTLGWAALIGGAVLASEVGVGVLYGVVASLAGRRELLDELATSVNGFFWALATLVSTPVGLALVGLGAYLRRGISVRAYLAFRRVSRRSVFRWCVATLAFGLLSDLLSTVLHQPIVPDVMAEAYRTAGSPLLLWLVVGAVAPLGEEIFFRGFIFRGWMHSRLGGWGTVFATALIWAIIHQQYDLYGIATIFAAGLLLGYARLRSGSIYPPLAMHVLMNLIAMVQTTVYVNLVGAP